MNESIIIIQDTREQQPWKFISDKRCAAQSVACLSEGDYTLADYPNLICKDMNNEDFIGKIKNWINKGE